MLPRRAVADLIEHEVVTLLGQRVFAIALGYEELNDDDDLRHDPMVVLAGSEYPRTPHPHLHANRLTEKLTIEP